MAAMRDLKHDIEIPVLGISFYLLLDQDGVVASSFEPFHPCLANDATLEGPSEQFLELESQLRIALSRYESGDFTALTHIPRSKESRSPGFYGIVQAAIETIDPGTTISYAQLAMLAGNPRAHRAAASACAKNPLALLRPCHRVIKSDHTIGGFGFDLAIKARLLDHENAAQGVKNFRR